MPEEGYRGARRISLGAVSNSRVVTKQAFKPVTLSESTQVVKEFIDCAIGTLLHARGLLQEQCFVQRNDQPYGHSLGHSEVSKLRRGFDASCDKILDRLQHGVGDAIEKGFLDSLIIVIYSDTENQDDVCESWQIVVGSADERSGKATRGGLRHLQRQCMEAIRTLHTYAETLQLLRSERPYYLSMKLAYKASCPTNYEPPGFARADHQHHFFFPTSSHRQRPEGVKLPAVSTPHHAVSVSIATLPEPRSLQTKQATFLWDAESLTHEAPTEDQRIRAAVESNHEGFTSSNKYSPTGVCQRLQQSLVAVRTPHGHYLNPDHGDENLTINQSPLGERFRSVANLSNIRTFGPISNHLMTPPFRTTESTCLDSSRSSGLISQNFDEHDAWTHCETTPTKKSRQARFLEAELGESRTEDAINAVSSMRLSSPSRGADDRSDRDVSPINDLHGDMCHCTSTVYETGESLYCFTCLRPLHAHCYGYDSKTVASLQLICWSCLSEEIEFSNEAAKRQQDWLNSLCYLATKRRTLWLLHRRRGWPSSGISGVASLVGVGRALSEKVVQDLEQEGFLRTTVKRRRGLAVSLSLVTSARVKQQMKQRYFTPGGGREADINKQFCFTQPNSQIDNSWQQEEGLNQWPDDPIETESSDNASHDRDLKLPSGRCSSAHDLENTMHQAGDSSLWSENEDIDFHDLKSTNEPNPKIWRNKVSEGAGYKRRKAASDEGWTDLLGFGNRENSKDADALLDRPKQRRRKSSISEDSVCMGQRLQLNSK